jgi:membrane fusion protein (multidrug efflux system)
MAWLCWALLLAGGILPSGCERIEAALHALKGGDAKPAEPPPLPVVVGTVGRRDVEVLSDWVATVDGSVNAAIRPRVNGYLIAQNYTEGSLLKTGHLMFEIDPRPFIAALENAEAVLARTRAEQIKTQLDVDRLTPLVVKKAVSQQELDDAVGANNANLAMMEANKADIDLAKLNLGFTKVIAPIDGIAGKANAQIGDLVGPMTPEPLTSMSTVDPLRVYFFATEVQYLQSIKELDQVAAEAMADRPARFQLILADGSDFGHRGTFLFADRQVDTRTGSIRIAVQFPNPGNVLRPGQFARIKAVTTDLKDAVVVPQKAVIDVQGSYSVAVVNSDSALEIRPVTLGPSSGSDWVITKGLSGGETIVVEGIQKVRSGVKVKPESPSPTGPGKQAPSAAPRQAAGAAQGPAAAGSGARSAREVHAGDQRGPPGSGGSSSASPGSTPNGSAR